MLLLGALRRPLAASAARLARERARARPQVYASLATGPRQDNGIFYEIRTYDVKPSKMKEFVEVINQHIHLRTAHSELVGFWTVELGAMNKAIHIWKYGVYEWVTFQMKPGGPALWGEAFRAAINTHINTGYTKLIGVFHTEYGLLNRVHVIWWNESPDNRAAGRHKAHEDARVVAAVRESVRFLESQENMLLVPLHCSPLK
ncbi:protein NipSnap homolog 3A isoform X2 [Dromaius novaehollandiae]|uniref:protein NipSnap homolog 3A isoform X2 n=1 Tax=Dromaius novaehollandiae TaxID=8790 RepID=UPI00311E831B